MMRRPRRQCHCLVQKCWKKKDNSTSSVTRTSRTLPCCTVQCARVTSASNVRQTRMPHAHCRNIGAFPSQRNRGRNHSVVHTLLTLPSSSVLRNTARQQPSTLP
uniref:Uncharacterized protein n=1 Tax=Cacopsylla melanoneura TaxID=428564 RepID=A0A8D8W186_9HEMI